MPNPKSPLTNFLTGYFDCAHFLFCSPFRFVYNKNTGYFSIKKCQPQLAIFMFVTTLSLFYYISGIRISYNDLVTGDNTSPEKYFRVLTSVFISIFQISFLWKLIFRQSDLLDVLNFIQAEAQFLPVGAIKIQRKGFILLVCLLFASLALTNHVWWGLLAHPSIRNETLWNRRLISETQYSFFLINVTERFSLIETEDLTGFHYFLAGLGAIAKTQVALLDFFPDLCLLFGVLTVWTAAYKFSMYIRSDMRLFPSKESWRNLHKQGSVDTSSVALSNFVAGKNLAKVRSESKKKPEKAKWPDVYRTYKSIRELCQINNHAFGSLITMYLGIALLYQATQLDLLITTENNWGKVVLVFFIGTLACVFLISADACDKLETLKTWLTEDENRKIIPLDQLEVVMGELRNRDVGVRGSNIFTITYPLLWSITSIVVTYFIICLQSRQGEHDKKEDTGVTTCNCTPST